MSISREFAGSKCCMLEITISPGSKVLPLWPVSDSPSEEEILLDREATWISTNATINNSMQKSLFITYIPPNSHVVETKEELKEVKNVFDNDLITERIVKSLENDDLDFVDEKTISIIYKSLTGNIIPDKDLEKVMHRLFNKPN